MNMRVFGRAHARSNIVSQLYGKERHKTAKYLAKTGRQVSVSPKPMVSRCTRQAQLRTAKAKPGDRPPTSTAGLGPVWSGWGIPSTSPKATTRYSGGKPGKLDRR
jgi:hypothetical protein